VKRIVVHGMAIAVITALGYFALMVSGGINDHYKHPGHFEESEMISYYAFSMAIYLILAVGTMLYLYYSNSLPVLPVILIIAYSLFHILTSLFLLDFARSSYYNFLPYAGAIIVGNSTVLIYAAIKVIRRWKWK